MKILFCILLLSVWASAAESWQVMMGGPLEDQAGGIALSRNGGIVIVGTTELKLGGNRNIVIAQINSKGKLKWQKQYSSSEDTTAESIAAIPSGGYIVAGNIYSERNSSFSAPLLIRIDDFGRIIWQKTLAATGYLVLQTVLISETGHIFIVGEHDNQQRGAWAAKMNLSGHLIWQEKMGGTESVSTSFLSASATKDGGLVGVGQRIVTLPGNASEIDIWAAKLSVAGKIEWQKVYRLNGSAEGGLAVTEAGDGTYLIVGSTFDSAIALKVNNMGEIEWQTKYSSDPGEDFVSVAQSKFGSFVLGGSKGDIFRNGESLFLEVDPSGITRSLQRPIFGKSTIAGILERPDGSLFTAGYGKISSAGELDIWAAHLTLDQPSFCSNFEEPQESQASFRAFATKIIPRRTIVRTQPIELSVKNSNLRFRQVCIQ